MWVPQLVWTLGGALILAACATPGAHRTDTPCSSDNLSVMAALERTPGHGPLLVLVLSNHGTSEVEVPYATLSRGNLLLLLAETGTERILREDRFSESPAYGTWRLRKGESATKRMKLAERFPELGNGDLERPIVAFWNLPMNFGCEGEVRRVGGSVVID